MPVGENEQLHEKKDIEENPKVENGSTPADFSSDDDDETKENYEGFNGTGRTVTLQMLMSANVLQPGKSLMTIEYLGQKFVGDLLPDGKIKSQETETIFVTPSAWAMHCKRIINPEKKSGCGWASVKYKGKKLDVYKNSWLRKCALQKELTPDDYGTDAEKKSDSPLPVIKRSVFPHSAIANRNVFHDANMLIEAVPFTAVAKLQPFLVTVKSSALLLVDFHCHLTMHEVCGYLGGTWDVTTQTLDIVKAYPCLNIRFDRQKASEVEREIQKSMIRDQLTLVGWYHSHPKFQAEPTLRDCDSQLEYQMRMRGSSEATYTPCIALILSPYHEENPTLESVIKSIWVVPPIETKQTIEYGRPMLMQYTIFSEEEIPEIVRSEIQCCVDYYSQFRNEIVKFNSFFSEDITFLEKLKNTLYPKFPFQQNDKGLWNWICAVLNCAQEDNFIPPKTIKIMDHKDDKTNNTLNQMIAIATNDLKSEAFKYEDCLKLNSANSNEELITKNENMTQAEQKASELKVMSLQEQLCLPSGLNMNPVRMLSPLATPNPIGSTSVTSVSTISSAIPPHSIQQQNISLSTTGTTVLMPPGSASVNTNVNLAQVNQTQTAAPGVINIIGSSPIDSPVMIPTNSASPAKFEVPVRKSPSPAKSDASSHTSRARISPAPSPNKFSTSDIPRNSPSITPTTALLSTSTSCLPTANDLMAASLAQLAGQLAPNFLQTDITTLFQQQRKEYGSSSLNQLAAAAAKVGGGPKQPPHSNIGNNTELNDTNVAAAVAAYTNTFNIPRVQDASSHSLSHPATGKSKSERSVKSVSSSSSTASNSYKTKLMKDLDDLKNDPLKMGELMRSPEYAALLLQQAEALGATTLGSLGFGSDFSYLSSAGLGLSNNNSNTKVKQSSSSNSAVSAASLTTDYNNLIQASKLLGYDSYMQSKSTNDLNNFLQQQMASVSNVPPPASISNSKKAQSSQQQHADYTTLLQTYSKLFDSNNQFGIAPSMSTKGPSNAHHELSTLLAGGVSGVNTLVSSGSTNSAVTSKQNKRDVHAQVQHHQSDMLNQILQTEKHQTDLNALLYHQNKAAADLNALFAAPSTTASSTPLSSKSCGSGSNSTGAPSPLTDPAAYYNALAQEKIQDYAAFFQQQHSKYGMPDPLSKSTLAANNLFMTPSTLLKMQQESISAIMKPPKTICSSSSSALSRNRESSTSPALERLTPTKIGGGGIGNVGISGSKYNFSAVDLAISSVPSNSPSPAPSDGSNCSTHRRPSNTPPVDLSRLYGELVPPTFVTTTKKRMEFSSIADLAAPPPSKIPKTSEDVLNLCND